MEKQLPTIKAHCPAPQPPASAPLFPVSSGSSASVQCGAPWGQRRAWIQGDCVGSFIVRFCFFSVRQADTVKRSQMYFCFKCSVSCLPSRTPIERPQGPERPSPATAEAGLLWQQCPVMESMASFAISSQTLEINVTIAMKGGKKQYP